MKKHRIPMFTGVVVLACLAAAVLGCSQKTDRSEPAEDPLLAFDVPPNPTKQVSPEYPSLDGGSDPQGMVWIEVLIDETGHVTEARVDSSDTIEPLQSAALEAARLWEFEPAQRNQTPVKSKVVIPFKFEHH